LHTLIEKKLDLIPSSVTTCMPLSNDAHLHLNFLSAHSVILMLSANLYGYPTIYGICMACPDVTVGVLPQFLFF